MTATAGSGINRNSLKMQDGSWFQGNVSALDVTPIMRVHTDASYNSNAAYSGHPGGIVGVAYCVELADDASMDAVPNYAYIADDRPINVSSTVAEMRGMNFALQSLNTGSIELVCDNTDAVNLANYIFNGGKSSDFLVHRQLMRELKRLERFKGSNITARWERGHNANPYNHAVNMLARMARRIVERNRDVIYAGHKEREMIHQFKLMRSGEHFLVRNRVSN